MTKLPKRAGLHRIVIVGGGAGGLELACRLGRSTGNKLADVILVDRNTAHLWKPRLHEVAAGLTGPDETSYLSLAYTHGFEFCLGELAKWSQADRTIEIAEVKSTETDGTLLDSRTITYDTLIFALGSRVNDFGIPGVSQYCHMLDGTAQAARLQRCFLEAAVKVTAGKLDRIRVGIVGAGATGVELAAELHHAAHTMEQYGGVGATGNLDVNLIDQAGRVLPAVDLRTSAAALKSLQRMGVKVLLGQGVRQATKDGFELASGDILPCEIMVWASGIAGHPIAATLGLPLGRGGRILVDENLACVGIPDVFAIGDCAAAPADKGKSVLPPTAQVAHQQASYLAQAIPNRIQGHSYRPFRYRPRGTLVSLGAREAAAELVAPNGGRSLPAHGLIAKVLYVLLFHAHRATLHGWWRAILLFASDRLRRSVMPTVKLH